mgnify:CR=1 FL=1
MASRHTMQREISPAELGLNAATGLDAGTKNSSSFDCSGFNQLSLDVFLDRGNGSSVTFQIEVSPDNSTFHLLQASSISSGTATLSDLTYSKATGGDKHFTVDMPLNYEFVRVANITAGSTDAITVTARLANL